MSVLKNEVGRPSNETIKKRNILKVLTFVIVITLGFLSGYLLANLTNDKRTVEVNVEAKENLGINSKQVMDLYIPFSYFMHEADKEELYSKDKITPDDLSIEYKNRLAFAKYYYEYNETNTSNLIKLDYSSSNLENYYKKLFGNNAKYTAKSFNSYSIDASEMTYDEKTDSYMPALPAGDLTYYRYANEVYKAVKKDNTIEIYEYVVVYNLDWDNNKFGIFKNLDDAKSFKNAISIKEYNDKTASTIMKYKDKQISNNGIYLDNLREYKANASKYKLIFEKEDNNYIFKSIEKIK